MASSRFTKAKSEQGFLKLGLYGQTGSGKSFTALLFAEGLAAREKKRIAYIDTERGTEFYSMDIKERRVHPAAFDFDRMISRSLMETLEAAESLDAEQYGVLVVDSITHLWDAAKAAYTGKVTSKGGIPVQAWGGIKKPYKRLMSILLDGNYHVIICGREGVVLEDSEDGDLKVIGAKMKAEGETPHEPHILGRMQPNRDEQGGYVIRVFFEKDRSGILTGRTFEWPNYETIAPVVAYLRGGEQGKLGTPEENAARDAEAQERAEVAQAEERRALFDQIRAALVNAKNKEELKAAWSLTTGKKGKLGDELHDQLATIKDTRKAELLAEVA